ncbi:MAG: DUF4369 domain-containing protein, partial [Flavisolibacter sp.]
MNKLFLLLLLPVISIAQSPKEFELKGKLNLSKPVDWVYLRYMSGDDNVTDSLQPKNGEFKFKGIITEPVVATLITKFKQQGEDKPAREFIQLFLEPVKVEFNAKDSLKNNTVKGSAGYADFAALTKQQEAYSGQFDALYDAYDSLQKAGDKEGMKKTEDAITALNSQMNESVYASFVKKHPNS